MTDVHRRAPSTSRLSPEEIINRGFASAFRGVSETEVRNFLRRIADDLSAMRAREAELNRQIEDLKERLANPPPVTEQQLLEALGEETARVLRSAQDAAEDMRKRAEEKAAARVAEAKEAAERIRQEAEQQAATRTEIAERRAAELEQEADQRSTQQRETAEREATELRETTTRETDVIRSEAEQAAATELENAKTTSHALVDEARTVRERVLSDLARRRSLLQAQVDELRSGRDRLLDAYRVVKHTLGDATEALGQVEARANAELAEAPPRISVPPVEGELEMLESAPEGEDGAVEVDLEGQPAAAATPPAPAAVAAGGASETPDAEDSGAAVDALFARLRSHTADPAPGATIPPPPAPGKAEPAARVEPAGKPETKPEVGAKAEPAKPPESVKPPEPAAKAEPEKQPEPDKKPEPAKNAEAEKQAEPAKAAPVEPAAKPKVEPARVEAPAKVDTPKTEAPDTTETPAKTEAPVAKVAAATAGAAAASDKPAAKDEKPEPAKNEKSAAKNETSAKAEPAVPEPEPGPTGDDALRVERGEVLGPITQNLVRRAKRALQDQQNEILAKIRTAKGKVDSSTVLDDVATQEAAWADVLREPLTAAYTHPYNATAAKGRPAPELPAELIDDLAHVMVESWRIRLVAAIDGAGDDTDAMTQRLGARYREYRGRELDAALGDAAAAVWARGTYDAVPNGTKLAWVAAEVGRCPDCDDNALEPTPRSEPFPTGQRFPPAHPGCRCFLARAVPDGRSS